MRNKPHLLAALMLVIAILSCDVPTIPTLPPIFDSPTNTDTAVDDSLATSVAATLTAVATEPACDTASVLTVAYTNNGNVWLVAGTNSPLQLTSGGDASGVAISGDGQKVAFTTWNQPTNTVELRVVNSDGSGETALLSQADLDALPPALGGALHHTVHRMQFKPCSQSLLFSTRSVYDGPGLETQNNLLEIDTNSGIVTTILAPGTSGTGVFISPDGTKLALSFPERIDFANIDGSGLVSNALTYTPVITYSEFLWNPPVQWTSDSTAVGLAMPSQDPFAPSANGDIWLIPADGSAVAHMATIVANFYQIQYREITISPNLGTLAYLRDSGTLNVEELYFSNFDGSGEVLYDTADLRPQGWSPDSINYAYIVTSVGGAELRIGRLGNAPLTLTTTTGTYRDVRWVDASRMLHFSGANPSWDLQITHLGSGTFTLASTSGSALPIYDFVPKP